MCTTQPTLGPNVAEALLQAYYHLIATFDVLNSGFVIASVPYSAGCEWNYIAALKTTPVMAELWCLPRVDIKASDHSRSILFPGKKYLNQMATLSRVLGPGVVRLQNRYTLWHASLRETVAIYFQTNLTNKGKSEGSYYVQGRGKGLFRRVGLLPCFTRSDIVPPPSIGGFGVSLVSSFPKEVRTFLR